MADAGSEELLTRRTYQRPGSRVGVSITSSGPFPPEPEAEATAPTEHYLAGNPELSEFLETGLDYLGVDVVGVENAV